MKTLYKWVLLAITTCMLLSVLVIGCGQKNTVATINKRSITRDEYVNRLELTQVPGQAPGQQMDAGAYVLQRMIDEELILQLAESKGVKPTDAQIQKRLANAKKENANLSKLLKDKGITEDQFKQMVTIQQAVFNLSTKDVKVDDKDVKAFYDQHKQDIYTVPEQAQIAIIVTKSKADADKAIGMLDKGIQFSTVARSISIETNTAANGGSLGTISKGQRGLPTAIQDSEAAIFSTAEGHHTSPTALGGGKYAIFQVQKKDAAKAQSFNDVEEKIRENLMLEKGRARKNDVAGDLEKFRKGAKIDVSIERYKNLLLQKDNAPTGGAPAAGQ